MARHHAGVAGSATSIKTPHSSIEMLPNLHASVRHAVTHMLKSEYSKMRSQMVQPFFFWKTHFFYIILCFECVICGFMGRTSFILSLCIFQLLTSKQSWLERLQCLNNLYLYLSTFTTSGQKMWKIIPNCCCPSTETTEIEEKCVCFWHQSQKKLPSINLDDGTLGWHVHKKQKKTKTQLLGGRPPISSLPHGRPRGTPASSSTWRGKLLRPIWCFWESGNGQLW